MLWKDFSGDIRDESQIDLFGTNYLIGQEYFDSIYPTVFLLTNENSSGIETDYEQNNGLKPENNLEETIN